MVATPDNKQNARPSFKTLFAVPLNCQSCVDDISAALSKVQGISEIDCDINGQVCEVEGSGSRLEPAAPSEIVEAIQNTGREAILRGSGQANSAAVCILELHELDIPSPIRGLARMVQVAPNTTIIDLSIQNHLEGSYTATLRQNGDISRGAASTGGVWEGGKGQPCDKRRGTLGNIQVGKTGKGSVLIDSPVAISEIIGRSIVVSRSDDPNGPGGGIDESTLVGVIARSAGVWENLKTVCSCSGKTVWEERKEQVGRGMI